jgi:hypothetical protein
MASTPVVLVAMLIVHLLAPLVALAAASLLARRNGRALKSMSWSSLHGFIAEFFEPEDPQSGDN